MKATLLLVTTLVLVCGRSVSQQKDELTETQKKQIISEVTAVSDTILARMLRLDFAGTLEFFWDSPEFIAFWPNAASSSYQGLKENAQMNKDSLASLWITKTRDDFPLVAKDLVLHVLISKYGYVTKSGATAAFDPDAETHLFRKIDGQWKIAFVHESAKRAKQEATRK